MGFIQIRTCGLLDRLRRNPRIVEPLRYHFRYADLIVKRLSEQTIYTDIMRAVVHMENMVAAGVDVVAVKESERERVLH